MSKPPDILEKLYEQVMLDLVTPIIESQELRARLEFVCRCISNRAAVRLLMACLLAKLDRPTVDPRKPYTEIGTADSFSGRYYDENYITYFVNKYRLPCNSTTAFLTPALRNIDRVLTTDVILVGRPREVYVHTLQLLNAVSSGVVSAENVLQEVIRLLVIVRDEKEQRMATLLDNLRHASFAPLLSSEEIVTLIEQHLKCKSASRLPVLVVAAAYKTVADKLGERIRPLMAHNAADEQTGSLGDVEVALVNEDRVVTAYEMKMKRVTIDDIDRALQKLTRLQECVDNYIFITTDVVTEEVRLYAASIYERTGGTEVAILDCIGFLRHFLHLFHRLRMEFLNNYQALLLVEPESAVSQPLKEAFLALRQAAETNE